MVFPASSSACAVAAFASAWRAPRLVVHNDLRRAQPVRAVMDFLVAWLDPA
jgi:hypothetical protein